MKKTMVMVAVLAMFVCTGLFAQDKDMPKERPRNLKDSGIKIDEWYGKVWSVVITSYKGPTDNPEKNGPIYDDRPNSKIFNGKRFPSFIMYPKQINMEYVVSAGTNGRSIKSITTGPNQYVEFIVLHDKLLSTKATLYILQPNSLMEFNPTGKIKLKNAFGKLDEYDAKDLTAGFVLRKGSIKIDNDHKEARKADEAMDYYCCVVDSFVGRQIIWEVDKLKGTTSDKNSLVNAVISVFSVKAGLFSLLTALAPVYLMPAEIAYELPKNMMKASLAYAIWYAYTGKKKTSDEIKADLYVLLAGDNVEETLRDIGKQMGLSGNALTKAISSKQAMEEALKDSKQNLDFSAKVIDIMKVKYAKKWAEEGIDKAVDAVPLASNTIGVISDTLDFTSFATQVKKYYSMVSSAKDYSGNYYIVAKNGSALHVAEASKNDGGNVVLYKGYDTNTKQCQWKFERQSDGTYIITNVNSGKVMDIPGGSKDDGAYLIQYTKKGGNNQKWRIDQIGDYVTFVNVNSGKVIDIPGNTNVNNTKVIQYGSNKKDNQQFKLVQVK